jgi:hypothetical protein
MHLHAEQLTFVQAFELSARPQQMCRGRADNFCAAEFG